LQAIQAVQRKNNYYGGKADKDHKISKPTILDKIKLQQGKLQQGKLLQGHPIELTAEEDIIVQRMMMIREWGFPLTRHNPRHLIKSYLDGLGRTSVQHVSRNLSQIFFHQRKSKQSIST
jgi:hypothetical protein